MQNSPFFSAFNREDFESAASDFDQLNQSEKESVLKKLFYEAREAKAPTALGVLYRQLHDEKEFDDFFNAWMPPRKETKPFIVGDKTYHHYFDAPTRVINAVNFEDPSEVISIGMVWCTEEEFLAHVETAQNSESNTNRRNKIATVADKISAKLYRVEADTQLGN